MRTCSEDDTRVQGRQSSNRTDYILKQHTLNAASGAAAKVKSKDASGSRSHLKSESQAYTVSAPIVPSPSSLSSASGKINSIRHDVQAHHGSLVNSSRISTEQFIRTGAATVGMFSGLMNHMVPATNGKGFLTPQTVMVDATHPITTTKSSSGKSRKQASAQTSPSICTEERSTSISTFAQSDPTTRTAQTATVRAKQNTPGDSVRGHRLPSNTLGQRQSNQQKAKFHSGSFVSDTSSRVKVSERNVIAPNGDDIKSVNKFQNPIKSTRFPAGGALSVNRSVNSFRTVELYYHTLQHLKWGPSAEETLNNLQSRLDTYQANQVLKLLRDHSVAFGFFKWLKHQPMFKHDEHSHTTMIGILGQERQFDTIKRLLDEMKRERCHPTVVTYNRLIHSYGRANYIGEAVQVFNEMQELGYEPDRVTYCTLIDIHAKAGFLDVSLDLYQKMQEVGLSPDTFSYSTMVNCLGKAGHLPAAYKLFCEMIERGCVPNLVTYNIMIALQAKARNYSRAVKLYSNMQAAGFRPDKITYNIVMEVLGHCGRLDEAEAVFQEMEQDWVPDEPVYGLLVDLWGKSGNVDKARAWFTSMLDAGLRPNVPTCNSLLSAFLRMQRFSDAHDVLQKMLGMGLVPSLQTYTLLLSCCTETRAQMGVCCELMAVTGHPAHHFLVSLPDAEPGGQNVRDHASHFMELMHSEDRESKRGLLDAVIDFLHKSGLKEEAGFIWEVAAERNVYPESLREKSSSYWLINLHVMSEGTAVTALSRTLAWFQRRILESGTMPRRIDIITGWGRRSRVTGSSLVRQSVQELLHMFRFPFFTENGNSGCFVGCGEPLNRWLLNSYVERMHLV
ncbi:pentatricopeptide repeat-containing protein-like [Iris pallida]|uniref:Pentatricopeptide repeat-containing protein-like n=1 Tax=Iris pallida TaxID=29817 RepID=A0AAX6ERZ0_IRIPA|nr:pentatricopeptide repeat-containing protein-like [Iris pallida]